MQSKRNELQEESREHHTGQQALDKWVIAAQRTRPTIEGVPREETLPDVLDSLKVAVPEIQVILIVTVDGVIIGSKRFDCAQDDRIIEAMTAALVSVAEQASLELNKGEPTDFIIRSSKGLIFIKRLDEAEILIILTREEVHLELLEVTLNQAIPQILRHLEDFQERR